MQRDRDPLLTTFGPKCRNRALHVVKRALSLWKEHCMLRFTPQTSCWALWSVLQWAVQCVAVFCSRLTSQSDELEGRRCLLETQLIRWPVGCLSLLFLVSISRLYIYICIYMHIYLIYTYTYTYTRYVYIHPCPEPSLAGLHVYMYTYICIYEKTREFQTQLICYFSKSDNKSNHHHIHIQMRIYVSEPCILMPKLSYIFQGWIHTHTYIYICTRICTCIYIYTYIYSRPPDFLSCRYFQGWE